jgi:hypothetical protein
VLAARSRAYASLRRDAASAIAALADDPGYRTRLVDLARARLGDREARILEAAGGGVIAEIGSRRVDYSLDALLQRCLDRLGDEIAGLWA